MDVIHLVLGGYLSNVVRLSGMEGYASVHVDPDEVREKLDEHLPGVSVAVVAARMHLPPRTVWALLEDREDGALLGSMVLHGPNGRHVFRRVPPEVVERFQQTYATTVGIAATMNVGRTVIERELRSARLRPAIPSAEVGVDFFRIDELPTRYRAVEKVAARTEAPPALPRPGGPPDWAALVVFTCDECAKGPLLAYGQTLLV